MDYKAAIAALKQSGIDNAAELVSAIEGHIEGITSKNYEIIGEKRNATSKLQSLETALGAIATALGLEGGLESLLESTEGKVKAIVADLASAKESATQAESRATAAEGKVKGLERKGKLTEVAQKSGAVAEVLERLLGDKLDEVAIADDGTVKIGDKALRDYVDADAMLKPFLPALFPTAQAPEQKPEAKLPSGSPTTVTTEKPDPVSAYIGKAYTGINVFTKKA